jgi:hypothetical protein
MFALQVTTRPSRLLAQVGARRLPPNKEVPLTGSAARSGPLAWRLALLVGSMVPAAGFESRQPAHLPSAPGRGSECACGRSS